MSSPITLSPEEKMEKVESFGEGSLEVLRLQRIIDSVIGPELKMKADENIRTVSQRVLRGMTSADFVKLPAEERFTVYRQQLVLRNAYVRIEEGGDEYGIFNPEIAEGTPLRDAYYMGDDAAGQQIVKEARYVYYKENKFIVSSSWLGEFLLEHHHHHRHHNGPLTVNGLIRHIAVTVSVEDDEESTLDGKDQQETETVCDLRQLLQLHEVDFIDIYIIDACSMDGSDRKTRKKMEEIFPVVQELVEEFQELLSILIVPKKPGHQRAYHNVTAYFGGYE